MSTLLCIALVCIQTVQRVFSEKEQDRRLHFVKSIKLNSVGSVDQHIYWKGESSPFGPDVHVLLKNI